MEVAVPDMMHREGHNITSVVFLPKTHNFSLIVENTRQTQVRDILQKRTHQKDQAHERQELSQSGGCLGDTQLNAMWDPRLDPGVEEGHQGKN